MQAVGGDSDGALRIMALMAMDRREEALQIAQRATPPISGSDNTEPMRKAVRLYLENRREEALSALHAASGVDPANDTDRPSNRHDRRTNLMYADGRVSAVVDWELAHFGDPMDDVAWVTWRTTQHTFTHLPDRLKEYEALSGHTLSPDRIRYYRVNACVRLA